MKKELALVYLVAGISSRFGGKIKSFVKITPRITLIELSLAQALKYDFSKIVFVVGNKTEKAFKEKFGSSYKSAPVFYALQKYNKKNRDRPWGTGDALCSAKPLLKKGFVICNGDDIYGSNSFKTLVEHLKKSSEEATISYKLSHVLPEKGVVNRGIIKAEKGYVKNIKEVFNIKKRDLKAAKRKPGDLCSMGIFALHSNTLKFLNQEAKKFKKKHKGDRKIEFLLPNELSKLIKKRKIKMKNYPAIDRWVGVTNPGDEKKAREFIKKHY